MKNPKTILRLLFTFLLLPFFQGLLRGQMWQNSYPGTDAVQSAVIPTPDDGFFASAWGSYVAFKTDANGIQQWTLSIPDSLTGYGSAVTVLPDGNLLVVGGAYTTGDTFQQYVFAIKADLSGTVSWFRLYPVSSGGFYGQSVAVAADGGLFFGGPYNLLMKTDAAGNLLWQTNGVNVQSLAPATDGGVVVLINDNGTGSPDMFIAKYNATLGLEWSQLYNAALGADLVGKSIEATADGGYVVTGYELVNFSPSSNSAELFLRKLDALGNDQWHQVYAQPGTQVGLDVSQTQDGGYVVAGWQDGRTVWLWRFDSQGTLGWDKSYFEGEGLSVQELSDGGFILLTRGLRLVRTDAQGVAFQHLVKGTLNEDQNADCQYQSDEPGLPGWSVHAVGNFTAYDVTDANGAFEIPLDSGAYQLIFYPPASTYQPCQPVQNVVMNSTPDTLDVGHFPVQAVDTATSTISGYVFHDLDGDCVQDAGESGLPGCIVAAGREQDFGNPQFFTTTDANGFYSFTLPAGTDYYFVNLAAAPENPYCQPCNNDFFQFLSIAPLTHHVGVQCQIPAPQHLAGFVFFDENENCLLDFGEARLDSWSIEAVKSGSTDTFTIAAEDFVDGHFALAVDTGTYTLTITPPNYLFLPCQFVQTVNVGIGGAPPIYFPLMPLADCPHLRVEIGMAGLRPCFSSRYFVNYCNEGTASAGDAVVEVTFPTGLTVDSSQISGTLLPGNVWQFSLGQAPVDSCGSFWIDAFLNCADTVGLTYCVEAHVFPDSICGPASQQWDGSSVELSAECIGDSVVLTIANAGWGDMSQALAFIVVEDNVLIRDSLFQLPSGAATQVTVFPNGATIVLSAQQAANHPGNSMPLLTVEGCGGDSISLGFVTQFPQDDGDSFIAIDCRESTASFDPNTKSAQPKGLTEAHFIETTTDLTYQITFQNLGTAPAQDVVILDTLSGHLDTGRIELGAASHPFTFEILTPNVLRFSFENIQLTQASLDSVASIGFVKFRVKQQPGNVPGTVIENRAGIYFDFNAPVITNTVTHRIPTPQMIETQDVELCAGESWNGQIFSVNTLLMDTVQYAFFDSIFIANIEVQPTLISLIDTVVTVGTEVFGVVIYSDTTFSQVIFNEDECLARTVTAHLLSDVRTALDNLQYLALAPNPTQGSFTMSGRLSTGAFCDAKLLDAYGRTLMQLFENEWIGNDFRRPVCLPDLPAGLYFVSFAVDGKREVRKLVVE